MPAETFGGMEGRSNHVAFKAPNNSWGDGMGKQETGRPCAEGLAARGAHAGRVEREVSHCGRLF